MEAGGFSCVVCGGRPLAGYPGKALSWNPAGSCGCRELGYRWGAAPTSRFPYLRGERRTGRARRGAGEMPALTCRQTAKMLSGETELPPPIPGTSKAGISLVRLPPGPNPGHPR